MCGLTVKSFFLSTSWLHFDPWIRIRKVLNIVDGSGSSARHFRFKKTVIPSNGYFQSYDGKDFVQKSRSHQRKMLLQVRPLAQNQLQFSPTTWKQSFPPSPILLRSLYFLCSHRFYPADL